MQKQIQTTVRKFIVDNFLYGQGGDSLDDKASLLGAGLIDSTGVLELVTFLESTFKVRVADAEIVPDNLDSVERIAAYVQGKLQGQPKEGEVSYAS